MRRAAILLGVVLLLVGLGFVCPQIAQLRGAGPFDISNGILLLGGVAMTLVGVGTAVFGMMPSRTLRKS